MSSEKAKKDPEPPPEGDTKTVVDAPERRAAQDEPLRRRAPRIPRPPSHASAHPQGRRRTPQSSRARVRHRGPRARRERRRHPGAVATEIDRDGHGLAGNRDGAGHREPLPARSRARQVARARGRRPGAPGRTERVPRIRSLRIGSSPNGSARASQGTRATKRRTSSSSTRPRPARRTRRWPPITA